MFAVLTEFETVLSLWFKVLGILVEIFFIVFNDFIPFQVFLILFLILLFLIFVRFEKI